MERVCDVCKKPKKDVYKDSKTGQDICLNCHKMAIYRDPSTHEKCSCCKKVKPVKTHNEFGKVICFGCYQSKRKKIGKCADCKKIKIIQALGCCYGCYQSQRRAKAKLAQSA